MNKNFVFISIVSFGCTDVKSSAVNTNGMFLNYSVTTEGEGTGSTANVLLRVGGVGSTTYVDLEQGDRLLVDVLEENQELSKQTLGVIHSYIGTFETDDVGAEFVLNFERSNLDSAPSSIATLPTAFNLTAPEEDTVLSRTDDTAELVISWDNDATEVMSIEVEGTCFTTYTGEENSSAGSHVIPMSFFRDNETETSACQANVIVERRKAGILDPNFSEGNVYGAQVRIASFRLER